MSIDDELRRAIARRTEAVEPEPGSLDRIRARIATGPSGRRRVLVVLGAAAVLVLVAAAVAVAVASRDGGHERVTTEPPGSVVDPVESTAPSTGPAPTATSSTTSAPGVTTTDPATTTPAPPTSGPVDPATVLWPRVQDEGRRFTDPVAAVVDFARDLAGFAAPVVGGFEADGTDSGTVTIQADRSITDAGGTTTARVERMADGTWWVVRATNPDIKPDRPSAGAVVVCDGTPFPVTGTALAFEGHVNAYLVGFDAHGTGRTIGETVVMGAGTPPAQPFEGALSCDMTGATLAAVMTFATQSAKDGSLYQYAAFPLRLVVG